MFFAPEEVEELRRLYESDTPVLAFAFKRQHFALRTLARSRG
jgi:hypothetical protein